jgi:hypothetical protein
MLEFTRRRFLSGAAGLTTLATVAPLKAFDSPGPLNSADTYPGAKHYGAMFQPPLNVVCSSESQFREAICLNGSWEIQIMPLPPGFREGYDASPRCPRLLPVVGSNRRSAFHHHGTSTALPITTERVATSAGSRPIRNDGKKKVWPGCVVPSPFLQRGRVDSSCCNLKQWRATASWW